MNLFFEGKLPESQAPDRWQHLKRLVSRGLTTLIALSTILIAFVGFRFWRWSDERNRVIDEGSQIANTSRGSIEYTLFGETGPVVLSIHGVMGGYDFGLGTAQMLELDKAGFRVLSVSRPGYLNTPLHENNLTPADQADLYAALLDYLDIQSVALIAVSGGGPSALEFANRYPERVWGIIMAIAITYQWEHNEASQEGTAYLDFPPILVDLTIWFSEEILLKLDTKGAIRQTLVDNTNLEPSKIEEIADQAAQDTEKVNNLKRTFRDSTPLSRRWEGTENDLVQQQNLMATPDYSLIQSPVLAFYGEKDPVVPLLHGQYLENSLNNVEIYFAPEGGHAPFLQNHWSFIKNRSVSFLQENIP
ncbi:MAG: alpha/beta hydrolase [Anaerolineales bacterium]|nr:MAG: alpha/beta hydrolase [Anaerolineales bacterium]